MNKIKYLLWNILAILIYIVIFNLIYKALIN